MFYCTQPIPAVRVSISGVASINRTFCEVDIIGCPCAGAAKVRKPSTVKPNAQYDAPSKDEGGYVNLAFHIVISIFVCLIVITGVVSVLVTCCAYKRFLKWEIDKDYENPVSVQPEYENLPRRRLCCFKLYKKY